jgi:hypothetical protein
MIDTPLRRSLPQAVVERAVDVASQRRFAAGEKGGRALPSPREVLPWLP